MTVLSESPVFAAPDIQLDPMGDGRWRMASRVPLDPCDRQVGLWLRRWAERAPDRVMLADRPPEGGAWRARTYAGARAEVDRLSAALLGHGLSPDRPLVILSDKSLRNGLLQLAALQVGIPVSPVSPAYALRPEARGRLRQCLGLLTPGMVYVEDGPPFEPALDLLDALPGGAEVPVVHGDRAPRRPAIPYDRLLSGATGDREAVEAAFADVGPDTPGKIMFTSGSTGPPKAAIVTHGNMTSNQAAMGQVYPFLRSAPPVVVDWQPWHHCGGGIYNWHAALAHGGSYYCDLGRPTPGGIATTVANLQGLHPTVHFNVPIGYDLLMQAFERAPARAADFFRDLRLMVYSAAGMPESLWRRMETVARRAAGRAVPMVSSYGMTEMAPMHTTVHWPIDRAGQIGAPIPGSEVLLVPAPDNPGGALEGRFELRGRGPNLSPGYYRQPETTAAALDGEGWFRTGDAVRLVDPAEPGAGLMLEGRLVEEFKLATGTWVSVGDVRTAVVSHAAPIVRDVIVVGENRPELGVLAFLDIEACRELTGESGLSLAEAGRDAVVRAAVTAAIGRYNAAFPASSRRIGRVLLLDHEPSFAAGETTDKGYINQRLARSTRAALVEALYAEDPAPDGGVLLRPPV